ncbi:MAG: polysaccharide deacetylase family protein [Bacteroidetes bacterium]|nr:polysaccharide deacetylase family protein [Bacteroidota bacterium]
MLLVYSYKITPRLKYTFNLYFKDLLGIDYKLTTSRQDFITSELPKISYSELPLKDEIHFQSRTMLFETGILDQNIAVSDYLGSKIFFMVGNESVLPFDVFAAGFYLVSRYEEYLPHIRDAYDRFEAKDSLAFQNNFLQTPIVNTWAQWIKQILKNKYPSVIFKEPTYKFISTIDIDNAYAYKEKGLARTLGGYAKSIIDFNTKALKDRTRVLLRLQADPYDTFQYQLEFHKRKKVTTIYFFLLGTYGLNDKNLSPDNKKFQSLIKNIADYAQVGIHPSFGSNKDKEQLKSEINILSKILHREITQSRQHFLKLTLPETYRNLIDFDITDDYTMGYASQVGFRASICTPFYFYDLDSESETKLRIHPFAMMEGTLKYYMNIDSENAMSYIKPLIDNIKAVNGTFISLWHNDTLSDLGIWKGWRSIYEEMVDYAQ